MPTPAKKVHVAVLGLLVATAHGTANAEDCAPHYGELGAGANACPCGDTDACADTAQSTWNGGDCGAYMARALWDTGAAFFTPTTTCATIAQTVALCGVNLCEPPTPPVQDIDPGGGYGEDGEDAGPGDEPEPGGDGDGGGDHGGSSDPFKGIVGSVGIYVPGLTNILAKWVITPVFGEKFLLNGSDTQLFLGTVAIAAGIVASAYVGGTAAAYFGTGYLSSFTAGGLAGLTDYLVSQSLLQWFSGGLTDGPTIEGAAASTLLGGGAGIVGKYLNLNLLPNSGKAANQFDNFADDAAGALDSFADEPLDTAGRASPFFAQREGECVLACSRMMVASRTGREVAESEVQIRMAQMLGTHRAVPEGELYKLPMVLQDMGVPASFRSATLDDLALATPGSPVMAILKRDGHAIMVDGLTPQQPLGGERVFSVRDPFFGPGTRTESELLEAFGGSAIFPE